MMRQTLSKTCDKQTGGQTTRPFIELLVSILVNRHHLWSYQIQVIPWYSNGQKIIIFSRISKFCCLEKSCSSLCTIQLQFSSKQFIVWCQILIMPACMIVLSNLVIVLSWRQNCCKPWKINSLAIFLLGRWVCCAIGFNLMIAYLFSTEKITWLPLSYYVNKL